MPTNITSRCGLLRLARIALFVCLSTVAAAQDSIPPQLYSLTLSADTVNAGDSITITIDIMDDISGIAGMGFPNGGGHGTDATLLNGADITKSATAYVWQHVTGNIYKSTVQIPPDVVSGTWTVILFAQDLAGNYRTYWDSIDFMGHFMVLSSYAPADTVAPQLLGFYILTDTVTAPGRFYYDFEVADSLSGVQVYGCTAYLNSRGGLEHAMAINWEQDSVVPSIWHGSEWMDAWSVDGIWTVDSIVLRDNVNNEKIYYPGVDYTDTAFFMISANPDYTPPEFFSIAVSPPVVHRGDSVKVTLEMRDTVSGLRLHFTNSSPVSVDFVNSFGQQNYGLYDWTPLTGNFYYSKAKIDEYAADGLWIAQSIMMADNAYNIAVEHYYPSNYLAGYTVIPDSLRVIEGTVLTDAGLPLLQSRVFLIKQHVVDSSIYVMRLATTDAMGHYQFQSEKRDSIIYIKAIPDTSYNNQVPTYLDTATTFTAARRLTINGTYTAVDTFRTLPGVNSGGFGFISGFVSDGAGKMEGGLPIANLELVLATTAGDPMQFAITDGDGYFEFKQIPDGVYRVYPVSSNVNLQQSPTFTISGTSSYSGEEYVCEHTHLAIATAIEETESDFKIFPNPAQSHICILFSERQLAPVRLFDSYGKEHPVASLPEGKRTTVDISHLPPGIYFLKLELPGGKMLVRKVVKV